MAQIRILAVEDDVAVCRLLQHGLAREDFFLKIVSSGEEALKQIEFNTPDLVLLDLGLPGIDGLEVCRQLRALPTTRSVPIIILSGKGDESDVIRGLEMGADDYIVKPFSPRILSARLRAALRRRESVSNHLLDDTALHLGPVHIDTKREVVLLAGIPLDLNPVEYHFIHRLVYFLAIEQKAEREAELGTEGTALYAENRLERLRPVLEALLQTAEAPEPILIIYVGLSLQARDAERCRSLLESARQIFIERGNLRGEMAAHTLLLSHHLLFDGDTVAAVATFHRLDTLHLDLFPSLSSFSRILVAQTLALGHALLFSHFERAHEHLAIADALVEERGLVNLAVINHLVRHIEYFSRGMVTEVNAGVEATLRLRSHPQVSPAHRALLCLCQLGSLALQGEFAYLNQTQHTFQSEFAPLFPPECLLRMRLVSIQVEALLWADDASSARALLQSVRGKNGLLRPLLDGQEMLCTALCGETLVHLPSFLPTETEPLVIDNFAVAQGVLFAVRSLLARQELTAAATLLAQVAPQLANRPWTVLQLQATALNLLISLQSNPVLTSDQQSQLQILLATLQQLHITHLSALLPEDFTTLFVAAHAAKIECTFIVANGLSRLHLDFSGTGPPLPLLQFDTLGGLQLRSQGKVVLRMADFSRSQRECLAALVAAPGGKIDQEEMQLLFWPESHPEKGRSNLDTMLSRLRKTLQDRICPLQAKHYLKLQKGVVSLEHIETDVRQFQLKLRRGHECLSKNSYWLADVAFVSALSLWNGPFIPGACSSDVAAEFAERIHTIWIDATLAWSEMLIDLGQSDRAETALAQALGNDRSNEALVRALYRCYMRSGSLNRAVTLLQQYEAALRRDGCTAADIARALSTVKIRIEIH